MDVTSAAARWTKTGLWAAVASELVVAKKRMRLRRSAGGHEVSFRQACVSLLLLSASVTHGDVQFREGRGVQGRTRGSVPAELAGWLGWLGNSLAWRQSRKAGVHIRERLWQAAMRLAGRHGVSRTAS